MKTKLIQIIFELVIKIISELLDAQEKREQEIKQEKEEMKKDIALADKIRKAYPSSSDDQIIKSIC